MTAKQGIARVLEDYYSRRGRKVEVTAEEVYTVKENLVSDIGIQYLFYGVPAVLLILLIIPAINIVTLNVANSVKQSEEIAIRRAIGASRLELFLQIIIENLILVVIGVFLGLLLFFPMVAYDRGGLY